jgi:LuxR family transcriptional regulator, activator of conjugal transfer of Ti plasmids
MTNKELVFENFIDTLWSAHDSSALRSAADRAVANLGFNSFAYLGLHEGRVLCVSSFPQEWLSRYFKCGYERLDPVIGMVKNRRRAFDWSSDDWRTDGNKTVRRFFTEAEDFGIRSGVTAPIASGFSRVALMTFASREKVLPAEKARAVTPEILELIGLYLHAHIDWKVEGVQPLRQDRCVLSQREIQCLEWASRGKTTAEIARIVSISSRTVTFHLENARRKLDGSNITQAVAIALRCRLIH